ncbi:PAS domain-containing protein [Kiloniella sp.]|uniref:PAS domain-containing protein n=1 Tax=Kiloniella sp. TaxID=1938587 RepID=UPI003B013900
MTDIEDAPEDVINLLGIWKRLKAENKFPLKSELNPFDFRDYLGRLCIIEIQQDPLDFIYRLDGTEISAASNEDLAGQSILDGTPTPIYQKHFDEFKTTFETENPLLWEISYTVSEGDYHYLRVVLPFAHDHLSTPERLPS